MDGRYGGTGHLCGCCVGPCPDRAVIISLLTDGKHRKPERTNVLTGLSQNLSLNRFKISPKTLKII